MKRSEVFFGILRIPLDALGVLTALLLSYMLRVKSIDLIPRIQLLEPPQTLPSPIEYFDGFIIPSIAIFICIAAVLGLYALRTTRSAWNEVGRLLIAGLLWLVIIIGWYFLFKKQLFYSRILLLHSTFFITLFILIGRACVVIIQRAFLRFGVGVRTVISLGKQKVPVAVKLVLTEDIRYKYLGHIEDKKDLNIISLNKSSIDLIVQTDASPESNTTQELINYCRSEHIGYAFLPPVLADVPHQLSVEHLGLTPLMRFQPTPLDGWGRVWKRVFDVVLSLVALIILSPVFLLISIGILIESGLPVFFLSRRIGDRGVKSIPVIKFRSMRKNADAQKEKLSGKNKRIDGPLFKIDDDPRVTSFGKILRRWDLDEFPQLVNVFFGQMSLVGPRPHLPEEVDKYTQAQRRVFAVKPGITGLAQVSGRSNLSFKEEMKLDLRYIEEWSIFLDLWILWRTIFAVWKGRNG